MYADAVARITESIFPIFFTPPDGSVISMAVSGTGFFIDDSGLFMTAHHVMHIGPVGSGYYYYGKVPDEVCQPAVEIEHVASDPSRDLYVGRIARDYLAPVSLSDEVVRPGDSVCLSGYPMALLVSNPQGGITGNIRRYWQPTFVIDATQALINNRLYDGYIVQHTCLRGMSGGPVFDMQARVRGMAVATLTRSIPEPGGTPTVVANGIVIDVEHIRRFIDASR
jgi:S1-C subfamily serine protease